MNRRAALRITLLAFCLTLSTVVNAQRLTWKPMSIGATDSLRYEYTALSSYGESCIFAASVLDQRIKQGPRVSRLLFRSDDEGRTWKLLDPRLPAVTTVRQGIICAVQLIDSLHIAAVGDSGLFIYSEDGGETWRSMQFPDHGKVHHVHFSDILTGMVCNEGDTNTKFTFDAGKHWETREIKTQYGWAYRPESLGGKVFRALSYAAGPLYYTDDAWVTIDSTRRIYPDSDTSHVIYDFGSTGSDTIVAYGTNWVTNHAVPRLSILKSLDAGMTWTEIPLADSLLITPSFMSSLSRPYTMLGGYSRTALTVFGISRDRGMTWGLDSISRDSVLLNHNALYLITVLPSGIAIGVVAADRLALTGIPVRGTEVLSSVESFENLVHRTHIFPNPARGYCQVESVASRESVILSDILGREVQHTMLDASGHAQFDISQLPRGVYSVILKHNGVPLPIGKVAVVGR